MPEKSFKMAELVADFLLFCQAKQLSKVTVKWYRSLLDHFSKESPEAFDQQAVVRYISHLQDHCYSEVTVNMHLRALQAFAHWCMEQELIRKDPMKGIKIKRIRTTPTIPTDQELQVLLTAFSKGRTGKRDRAIFLLVLDSGIRPGELISLQENEIDWETGRAIVRGKTGQRWIYFSAPAGKAMALYARVRKSNSGAFFVSHYGIQLSQGSIDHIFERGRRRAGVLHFILTCSGIHLQRYQSERG